MKSIVAKLLFPSKIEYFFLWLILLLGGAIAIVGALALGEISVPMWLLIIGLFLILFHCIIWIWKANHFIRQTKGME